MTTFVLVPGMWLGAWAWRDVTASLRAAGHSVFPLTLTGVADRAHLSGADLETHTLDIVNLIRAEELRDVVLVGHSYGGLPVRSAADRIPELIRRVVYVDSGPLPDGMSQADVGPPTVVSGAIAPPSWDGVDDAQAGCRPRSWTSCGGGRRRIRSPRRCRRSGSPARSNRRRTSSPA